MHGSLDVRCAVLADPQIHVIEQMHDLLESTFDSVFVVANGLALEEGIRSMRPALGVLDLAVARGNLEALVARLQRASSGTRLIGLVSYEVPAVATAALAAGLDAVVIKRLVLRDLLPAVDSVLLGHPFVTPELSVSGARQG